MKFKTVVLYLLIFFLPSNLALHFKNSSALVLGIYQDYLIPTIYLTDILIFFLFILNFSSFKKIFKDPKKVLFTILPFFFILFAQRKGIAFYKALKFSEIILLFYYLRTKKIKQKKIVQILFFSALAQSLLAIAQFLKGGSVLSYVPFGEQPFTINSPDIKKIILPNGALRAVSMGTFPHSNILAAFLAFTLALNIKRLKKLWQWFILFIIETALVLTFSLPAIFLSFLVLVFYIFNKNKKIGLVFAAVFVGIAIAFYDYLSETILDSFYKRLTLIKASFQIIKDNILFGAGLNNFLVILPNYLRPANINFFQPVHNFFLLLSSEMGVTGLIIFICFLTKSFKRAFLKVEKNPFVLIYLLSWLLLSLFDHYFYTLQQGLLLTAFAFYFIYEK